MPDPLSPLKCSVSFRRPIGKYDTVLPMRNEGERKDRNLRKLNSLREETRHEEKVNYFKGSLLKKSSFDLKDSCPRSKSRKMEKKFSFDQTVDVSKGSAKKPQTSESKRPKKNPKELKPMIFGCGIGRL